MADEVEKVEKKRSGRLAEQTARAILDSGRIVTDSDVLLLLRQWAFRKNKSRKNVLPLGSDHVESDTLGIVATRHFLFAQQACTPVPRLNITPLIWEVARGQEESEQTKATTEGHS